jgi:tetratricopeptide (TPR) repeat protein
VLAGDVRLLAEAAGFTKTKIFDKSAERYRVLVERHPDSVPLLTKLAASLEEIGADEERFALLPRLMALAPEEPGAYIGLAHLTFKRGDQPEAERLLLEALRVEPCSPGARATLAHLAAVKGDHRGQIRLLKEGVDQCNIADGFLNSYAYALATSPDGADRDGQEALRIAKAITSERDGERPDFLDTLAAAYAETGDFENAILSGKRAIALIEAEDQVGSLDEIMRHLALFEAGRPVRE